MGEQPCEPIFFIGAILAAFPLCASAMEIKVDWGPTKDCFDPKSPPMSGSDVPKGTERLRIRMIDLDAPDYPHGGGTVDYGRIGRLAYGAFSYKGPCPPSPHTYRFTVEALDRNGQAIASATTDKRFPER